MSGRVIERGGSGQRAESEHDLASAILAVFNEVAGTDFRSEDHLRKITDRLRERPDLTFGDHSRLIADAFRRPWWKGSPSPAVIYGSSRCFERQLNDADEYHKAYEHQRVGQDRSVYDIGRTD